jgi:hypothetical protein
MLQLKVKQEHAFVGEKLGAIKGDKAGLPVGPSLGK